MPYQYVPYNPYSVNSQMYQNVPPHYGHQAPQVQAVQNQMAQNQAAAQVQEQARPQNIPLKGWLVSCEDEARKAVIDFDGSIYVFPDFSHGVIHTKQINTVDYSAVFKTYKIEEQAQVSAQPMDLSGYVPKSDFDRLVQDVVRLNEIVAQLSSPHSQPSQSSRRGKSEGVVKNDES